MAKPTVTLTLAGDEAKLTEAFDKVGMASKRMSDNVDSASSKMSDASSKFDVASEASDTAETRFTGFADTISGVRDGLSALGDDSLSMGEKLSALGQAGADLAGGLTGFVIPAIQGMWTKIMGTSAAIAVMNGLKAAWAAVTGVVTAATHGLNAAMRANPIGVIITVIGLLVGAFVLLWNKSEGFRNFFIGMWNGIKTVVGNVVGWIKDVWNGIPGFFKGIVDKIGGFFSGIGNTIKNAFKGAINFVIDILNGGIGAINALIRGYNAIPFAPDIPQIPKIPRLHTGGVVPGMPGQEVLTMLQAGERVSTSSQGGGGMLRFISGGGQFQDALAGLLNMMFANGALAWADR